MVNNLKAIIVCVSNNYNVKLIQRYFNNKYINLWLSNIQMYIKLRKSFKKSFNIVSVVKSSSGITDA